STEFSDSQTFKAAEGLLPEPTNFFAYIDTALVYSRLDASLRPILLMAAAFMPAVAGSIDAGKLPSPEVITKHLSPIISSQRYDSPVSFRHFSCLWSLKRRKLLRFLKNVLSFCPYGYSKEKCILPSCSRLGN